MKEYFKIRQISTGLFSSGGQKPYFSKIGAIWKGRKYLKLHLQRLSNHDVYNDCKVVKYILQEHKTLPIKEFI